MHEHDCDRCTYITSYPLRFPYVDDRDGWRSGTPFKVVNMADVYLSCELSGSKYIVRYGIMGEYATTNRPSTYVLAPMIDGDDGQPYSPLLDICTDDDLLREDMFDE